MIVVREEHAGEASMVDALVESAFGRRDEARLVDALRRYTDGFVSMVALDAGVLVASAVLTPVTIARATGVPSAAGIKGLGLAPVAVRPDHQRRGIGTALVRHALQRSMNGEYSFAVVLGDTAYYRRFGFRPAVDFGLRDEFGAPDGAFQAIEFSPRALRSHAGIVRYSPEFPLVLS
jgi:putative acetyltransferase